jgi:hypothetical protein
MTYLVTHLAFALSFILALAASAAQPLVEENDSALPAEVLPIGHSVRLEPAIRAWKIPGPHSMEWTIAYNDKPLTFDRPNFQIALGIGGMPLQVIGSDQTSDYPGRVRVIHTGNGEPVYAQEDELLVGNTVEYELTKPDGTTVTSGVLLEMCYLPGSRNVSVYSLSDDGNTIVAVPGTVFSTGENVLHIDSEIHRLFGKLEPGEHTLVVHMDSGQRLATDIKREVVSEWFRVSTPKLRFTVVERKIPEPINEPEFVHNCLSQAPEGARWFELTNPLDEPISIMAEVDQIPTDAARVRQPYEVRGATDCLTVTGWVGPSLEMRTGDKLFRIPIDPGQTVKVVAYHGRHKNYLSRLRLLAFRDDDTPVTFVSGVLQSIDPEDLP